MARIEDLKASVAKATEKVEKCKAIIEKHKVQLVKKTAELAKKNGKHEPMDVWEVERKGEDIKGATKKLKEAEGILAGWQAKLDKETEKERFLNNEAPQVIKDFLEQWKSQAYEWHVQAVAKYLTLKPQYEKAKETAKAKWVKENPKARTWSGECDKFVKSDTKVKKYGMGMSALGGFVAVLATYRNEQERLSKLNAELENEKNAKMLDLINRVNAVVGSITDAGGLRISEKGNLDGIVIGTKGKAEVHTIGAGGYNIVCFHYRTLVHEIKEKALRK